MRRKRSPKRNKGLSAPVKMGTPIQISDPIITKKRHPLRVPIYGMQCVAVVECPRNKFRKWWIYVRLFQIYEQMHHERSVSC